MSLPKLNIMARYLEFNITTEEPVVIVWAGFKFISFYHFVISC